MSHPVKKSFRNYSEQTMKEAIENVRLHKTPIRVAARIFGVPRVTLKYKVDGKLPLESKMGPPPILSKAEENKIISHWVRKMSAAGFPVTADELTTSVQRFIIGMKRKNPFKNDRPGRTWLKSFLRRNPIISKCISQNLSISHTPITNFDIQNWFSTVNDYLEENNFRQILDDPSRIFNCDEIAFFLDPKGNRVLAKRDIKTISQQANENESLTVLITVGASGSVATPTVVFKDKSIPSEIIDNFPEEWGLSKSDSGWMTSETFFEFVTNLFYPWLVKTQVTLPVILFMDGHTSHLSLQTSQFCESRGIVLVALCPNGTRLLQPTDVAVFRTLEEGWREKVHKFRSKNYETPILKKDFPKLVKDVIEESTTELILRNGFQKCGLYPWNPQAVFISGQPKIEISRETREARIHYLKQGLNFLSDNIDLEKLNTFGSSTEIWSGAMEDTTLFKIWKRTHIELNELSIPIDEPTHNTISAVWFPEKNDVKIFSNHNADDEDLQISHNWKEEICHDDSNSFEQHQYNLSPSSVNEVNVSQRSANDSCVNPCNSNPHVVPSSFKNHFYFPKLENEEPKENKIKEEKLPCVVSINSFQDYLKNKMQKKEVNEQLKKEWVGKRRKNKREKNSKKK